MAFSPSESVSEEKIENYNWQLKGLNTKSLNFGKLKGKVVFVNFWATWCPPCRAELPMIQALYDDYKDKVAFVFVTSETAEEVNTFFYDYNYELPVYNSSSKIPQQLAKTNSIPATYIIDKKGRIRVDEVGAVDWNSEATRELIEQLLTE